MKEQDAAEFLRSLGWKVSPPVERREERELMGYRIDTDEGPFFMEDYSGEEKNIWNKYEAMGKKVKSVTFNADWFSFL